MNKDDLGISVTFDLADHLERSWVNQVISEVMTSIGFFASSWIKGKAEELSCWNSVLSTQDLPIPLFGSHFKETKHWKNTFNKNPVPKGAWNSQEHFITYYTAEIEAFGVLKTFADAETEDNGFMMYSRQSWTFMRIRETDDTRHNKLLFECGVNPILLKLEGMQKWFGCMGLDRFWILAFQDVVMQLHRRLQSRETVVWQPDFKGGYVRWLTLEYPGRMYFWDFDLYLSKPLGVPKIDAALDAYENDLRTDRLREKAIREFE